MKNVDLGAPRKASPLLNPCFQWLTRWFATWHDLRYVVERVVESVPMNQKQAIVRKERGPRVIRVIQPEWWVDEAVAVEIRIAPVAVRNEGNSMGREAKQASTPKLPRHQQVLRKELVC